MHVILNTPDPDDKNLLHESEDNRIARKNELASRIAYEAKEAKRQHRLDYYFSHHPPNGPTLSILRGVLAAFVDNRGETPRWLNYNHLFASFERLERAGILKVAFTVDEYKIRHYTSTSTAKPRAVRPVELGTLVAKFKKDIGTILETPEIPIDAVVQLHGCQWVTVTKCRVRLYFGGQLRALGCYPFATALRLQDALAFHFSAYRRPAHFNTSKAEAGELVKHPAIRAFAEALEAHWLATGVLHKPEEIVSTECRLTAVEKKLDEVLRLMQAKAT